MRLVIAVVLAGWAFAFGVTDCRLIGVPHGTHAHAHHQDDGLRLAPDDHTHVYDIARHPSHDAVLAEAIIPRPDGPFAPTLAAAPVLAGWLIATPVARGPPIPNAAESPGGRTILIRHGISRR